ncbi:MAG TPA: CPBP family intramembrane metalloprotease [Acholeplasmataceae bacterium]|nr:CPBP family intramembrane metalloprotease [Acholeplasmataceae bacterium]
MRKKFALIIIYCIAIVFAVDLIRKTVIIITNTSNRLFINVVTNLILYILLVSLGMIILRRELKIDFVNFKNFHSKAEYIARGYLLLIGANFIGRIILMILDYQQKSVNQLGIESLLKSKYMIIAAISIIIGPIIEELVFRKSLIDLLVFKGKYSPIISVIVSSLLFGLIHVIFNTQNNIKELFLLIPYFFQGMVLGYLYVKQDYNIQIPIFVHMLNNFIAVLVIVFVPAGF